ncbi:glycosyltransferase family protein [Kiloniella litopenaei]|uniref:glycosyltransferase family protein n=1 Tax=Kiloniella litopenaei TaxID=1549748 RepID=UPI0012FF2944|nr:glycosyltransferase [Kiloniella litopenaei]
MSENVLDRGLDDYIENHGPFDMVLTTSHILLSTIWEKIPEGYRRSYQCYFPHRLLFQLNNIREAFYRVPFPKAAVLLESDYYNFTNFHIDRLDCCDYMFGFSDQFWKAVSNTNADQEVWGGKANNQWFDFLKRRGSDIVPFHHMVHSGEFSFRPLQARATEWNVPGASYAARRSAMLHLKNAKLKPMRGTYLRYFDLLRRIGIFPNESQWRIKLLNNLFQLGMENSRYVFTCGSGLMMPIRKFFEIPASGALMVCTPCNGFEALGFHNGINAIISQPEELSDLTNDLRKNPDRAQRIAQEGQSVVLRHHTVEARGRQFARVVSAIANKTFYGAFFENGEIVLKQEKNESVQR